MPNEVVITNVAHLPVTVSTSAGKNRLATDTEVTVSVEDFIAFDNNADTFFTVTNAGAINDTIKVEIDTPALVSVTSTLTSTESGDEEKTALLVVNDLNADSTFSASFGARALHDKVYIIAKDIAEKGEFPNVSPDDFRVTVTGTTTVSIATDNNRIIRRNKLILGEPDPQDNRFVRLGIFGEVGSRTKAENPINIVVRKTLATQGQTVFLDKVVPTNEIWFIGGVAVADDVSAEFTVWEGIKRDQVDTWTADGTLFTEILTFQSLKESSYQVLLVNDTGTFVEGTDYVIEDVPTDETKSQVRWIKTQTKPDNGDSVKLTYDGVLKRVGLFVQGNSSQIYVFNAPIKLTETKFIIVSVSNKSANSSIVIANLSGFFELVTI